MAHVSLADTGEELRVGKIVAVGANYKAHIIEMGHEMPKAPMIFLKPSTSIIHEGTPIRFPNTGELMHHEVELGLVIGETCKGVPVGEAGGMISAYCLALDMTLRDVQLDAMKRGWPWDTAKGFDGACPLSDALPATDVTALSDLELGLEVNGELRQRSSTSDMLWGPVELVAMLSAHFTLERGDVILTGTPSGVGPVARGDEIHAWLGSALEITFAVR
jgi:2-keto-4-pentenoate hydratase/2-oxohepta-3-ene-1,7-dioic acid hydratase in catechol pathway